VVLLSECAEVKCEIEETLTSNVDEAASEPCVPALQLQRHNSDFRFHESQR